MSKTYKNIQITTDIDVRTYLAGQALAGYMATVEPRADALVATEAVHLAALGKMCVRFADAVIDELNAERKPREPVADKASWPPEETPLEKPVETPEFPEV